MATAADHKIIIEKGADFKIDLRVTTDGITAYPVDSYVATMYLMYKDSTGDIQYVKPDGTSQNTIIKIDAVGTLPDDANTQNGEFTMLIDEGVTALLKPDPADVTPNPATASEVLGNNPFATEYNYFYYIQIDLADDNIRVLRGKAAIRA